MTRVLHLLPHRGGGAETYVDALERSLGDDFAHERLALSTGRTPLSAVVSLPRRLPDLRRRAVRADIVHAHGDVAAFLAMGLRPHVVTTHGLHFVRRAPAPLAALVRRGLRRPEVICTSRAERDELGAGTVIHNAVPPLPPAEAIPRGELGVGDDDVIVLFGGRLEERKRPLLAAEAALTAGPPVVLLVAGEGPQTKRLAAVAATAPDRVLPLGHRDDAHRLYATADVFVAPADREGLSYAVLEAMGHGLAIVATPASAEAVGEAGLIVPASDAAALAQALRTLAADPAERTRLSAAARGRAETEFSEAAFAAATRAVYERVLVRSDR